MKKYIVRIAIFALTGTVLVMLFNRTSPNHQQNYAISYSDFIEDVRGGAISEVKIDGSVVEGTRKSGEPFTTYNPNDFRMIDELLEYGVKIKVEKPQSTSTLMQMLISWAPMLVLIAVWIYFMRKQQAGGAGQMGFGKSRAKLMTEDQVKVRFKDVAGVEEAKEDVVEMWIS